MNIASIHSGLKRTTKIKQTGRATKRTRIEERDDDVLDDDAAGDEPEPEE
jgi:hypothetical protein